MTTIHRINIFFFGTKTQRTKTALEWWWQQWGFMSTHWTHWKYVGKVITYFKNCLKQLGLNTLITSKTGSSLQYMQSSLGSFCNKFLFSISTMTLQIPFSWLPSNIFMQLNVHFQLNSTMTLDWTWAYSLQNQNHINH